MSLSFPDTQAEALAATRADLVARIDRTVTDRDCVLPFRPLTDLLHALVIEGVAAVRDVGTDRQPGRSLTMAGLTVRSSGSDAALIQNWHSAARRGAALSDAKPRRLTGTPR